MAHEEARRIIAKYLPRVDAGTSIVESRFPAAAAANRIVADMSKSAPPGLQTGGRPSGPGWGAAGGGPHRFGGASATSGLPGSGITSRAGQIIAQNAAQIAASGGRGVDIRVWASALEQAGATVEQIGGAYEAAGGDPVLAEQERRGETSGFLAVFVQGLEDRGIAPEVILGTYEQAGGRIG